MTTWLPSSLPFGQSALTIPCLSVISYGHTLDGFSILRSPIHFGISGTLVAVHCPESFVVVEFVESKTHPHQAGTLEF